MALNTMQAWRVESLSGPEQALVLRELPVAREPERVQQAMVEIGRLCAERRLVPLVGGIVPMADAAAALQALAAGGTMGRTVVDVWQ